MAVVNRKDLKSKRTPTKAQLFAQARQSLAKYKRATQGGWCRGKCGEPIKPGDSIAVFQNKWYHPACFKTFVENQPR